LEHSLTIQRTKLQEIVDDLVSRGSLSRTDADGLLNQLLASSKDYSQALLQVLDSVTADARRTISGGIAPVMATAGKLAETVRKAPGLGSKKPAASVAPSNEPVPDLSALTVAQIKPRLPGLSPSALRRARDAELAGKARKTVLSQIDQLLGARS
jgi:hypothetical protein